MNLGLQYPELVLIMVIKHTYVSYRYISFNVGPLCNGISSAWLSLAGYRHRCTVSLGLATTTKLLHHLAILSTPSYASIWCCCNQSTSFFNGSCSVYETLLSGTWYGSASSLTCRKKVPLEHPIPANTSLCSSCILNMVSALTALLVSMPGPEIK